MPQLELSSTAWHPRRTVATLNAVSATAQLGQFGIGFILPPIALQALGQSPVDIGLVSSATWAGMLVGLLAAPRLCSMLQFRFVAALGLLCSAAALATMPAQELAYWWLNASLAGFGTGLRWIANETWLYMGVPSNRRASAVGLHETLIGLASFAGPALVGVIDVKGPSAYLTGAAMCLGAVGLLLTVRPGTGASAQREHVAPDQPVRLGVVAVFPLAVAALGGTLEASWNGLFPVLASNFGWNSSQTAWQLFFFGVGSTLLQYPLGLLVQRYGQHLAVRLCAAVGMATVIGVATVESFWLASVLLVLLGGAVAGFLTVSICGVTDAVPTHLIARAISLVSVAFTASSSVGPAVLGMITEVVGAGAIPAFAFGLCALLLALARSTRSY